MGLLLEPRRGALLCACCVLVVYLVCPWCVLVVCFVCASCVLRVRLLCACCVLGVCLVCACVFLGLHRRTRCVSGEAGSSVELERAPCSPVDAHRWLSQVLEVGVLALRPPPFCGFFTILLNAEDRKVGILVSPVLCQWSSCYLLASSLACSIPMLACLLRLHDCVSSCWALSDSALVTRLCLQLDCSTCRSW